MFRTATALAATPVETEKPRVVTRTIDGRTPLVPAPPLGLIRVVSGRVNLFLELTDAAGEPTGSRRCIAALDKNDAVALPAEPIAGQRLVAVGIGTVEVETMARKDRATVEHGDLDAALEAMIRAAAPEESATTAWIVRPGDVETLLGDRVVAADHLAWAAVTRPGGERAEALHAIGPKRALAVEEGARLAVLDTAAALSLHGWDILDRLMRELLTRLGSNLASSAAAEVERGLERRAREQGLVGGALAALPALMDGRTNEIQSRPSISANPAVEALRLLCAAERIDVAIPSSVTQFGDAAADIDEAIRLSSLRSRRFRLADDWWRRDGSGFIALGENGTLKAVLRRGPGNFAIVDPVTHQRTKAGAEEASKLAPEGVVIFRPLPWRRLSPWDLVRHIVSTPARADMRWAMAMALVAALIGLFTPMITGQIMNEIVPFAETERLVHFSLGLVMVALGSALFQMVRAVALMRAEAFADGSLQAAVWDRLLRLPLSFYRRYQVGELMIKAMAPSQLRQAVSDTAANSALAAVFSVMNFAIMLFYDPVLAFAAFAFTGTAMIVLFTLTWWQLRYERTLVKADGAVSSFVLQILFGIQKIRLSGAENRVYARWLRSFGEQRLQRYRAATVANVTTTVNGALPIVASLLFFAVIGLGGRAISIGDFAAFTIAFGQFQSAMLGLVGALSVSIAAVPIYENMKPIMEAQPEVDPARRDPGALSGRIALRDVSFRYHEDGPPVLDRVDLTVEPGEFVALVGPSGSGKSTIFRMFLGFETPESGSVVYDGHDLTHLDLKAVRRQLGVVLQRGTLLPGSIHENIVGSAPLPELVAWEAARMAGFEDDVKAMPMGMHTMLSEGGGGLSGGQRQRLMIARAIVRKPRILLMDEATSALDNRTQAIVSESLSHMNATRIVIAHRLSTVRHADRIHVVEAGRIVQTGTYEDLIARDGPFREIALRQLA